MNTKLIRLLLISILIGLTETISVSAQENIFASYFDIPTKSTEGTEVTGRIHLERNKDVLVSPIPEGYHFRIESQDANLFTIQTQYDLQNRIMGVLTVAKGENTGNVEKTYSLTVALVNEKEVLNEFPVTVKIVEKPLWNILHDRYKGYTVSNKGSRTYGRTVYSETELEAKIIEIENNNGRFDGFKCYTQHPKDYLDNTTVDSLNRKVYGTIEYEWEEVANLIGGLGYSYAKSEKYGADGDAVSRERLKRAIYKAILAYTACVPVEGNDILIDGKPIGKHTGDGFTNLVEHNMIGHQVATHQWRILDPLVAPSVQLMPDMLKDMKMGDSEALEVHNSLVRIYQLFTSIVQQRRAIDNPSERWGEIQDTLYSHGAWSDANLGHRLRIMLALPIVWADYNRPMTYVQYWYKVFYNNEPFKDFSFSPGWSPNGVVADVSRWLTKFNTPSHQYAQSGFHPDGTISHHIGHGTDAAMIAYGFEWMTHAFLGFNQFKDTDFKLDNKYYQFPADRLLNVYPTMFYKGEFDFLLGGRTYLSDMEKFISKTYLSAIDELIESKSNNTEIKDEDKLLEIAKKVKKNRYENSGTTAFWVNEFLVHRRGENEAPFYASVKLKSERTVGAEDFDRVRKSWHAGSGILQLKVKGDEYQSQVLKNMDWHMLPGLTEEWRTDPLPAKGGAQASLPGLNKISGVLSDGTAGMAIYNHLPGEHYSSATALKSYHFIEDKIIALGSNIKRYKKGQQKEIFTCIDQSALKSDLIWSVNGKTNIIKPTESVSISEKVNQPFWVYNRGRGWIVFPGNNEYNLVIKSGKEINVTDKKIANNDPNYIVSIGHGLNPDEKSNKYFYLALPNVTADEMPELLQKYTSELNYSYSQDSIHAVYSATDKIAQIAFFKAGKVNVGPHTIESDNVAMVMLKENMGDWTVSVSDPTANIDSEQLTINTSVLLKEGKYTYTAPGIYPIEGEYAIVKNNDKGGSTIIVELPDFRDQEHYNYQAKLYAASPIVLTIPKKK